MPGDRVRPWLAAWAGGFAGTAAMTAALAAETRLRTGSDGPVDYDVSDHVVTAACTLLRRPRPDSAAGRRRVFNLVHWGYGSLAAVQYEALRRRLGPDRRAAVAFYLTCQTGAMVLFPTLGGTPPPWRWKRSLLATSLSMHALYVAVVVVTARRLRR